MRLFFFLTLLTHSRLTNVETRVKDELPQVVIWHGGGVEVDVWAGRLKLAHTPMCKMAGTKSPHSKS
jgi:hypothetical protein